MTSFSVTPAFIVNLDGEFNIHGQINGMSTDIERVPEKAVLGLVLIAIPHSGMYPTDWVRDFLVG